MILSNISPKLISPPIIFLDGSAIPLLPFIPLLTSLLPKLLLFIMGSLALLAPATGLPKLLLLAPATGSLLILFCNISEVLESI